MRHSGEVRVGTSGYDYDHWTGVLYPESLPRDERFACYAQEFDTVEINNTFYGLPEPETVDEWRERAPNGFTHAVKFSRYGTHMKHLADPSDTVPPFMERVRRLGDSLGPVLVQIPPNWSADPSRLESFLDAAPSEERWALEVRDERWLCDDVYAVLREADAALCIHDMIDDHPWEITADWLYLRYHGDGYAGGYAHQKLSADAGRIAEHVQGGLDVFVYFNNDLEGHAVRDARDLRRYVRDRLG